MTAPSTGPSSVGMHNTKPQLFVDTVFIPKRKTKANNKLKAKRSKSRKPALTRQERKEQGLCRCNQPAIQGQTRCVACAEKHRAWGRQYWEARRRAAGAKPRQRISDEDLLKLIQAEVKAQDYQLSELSVRVVHPDTPSLSRAQRKSLGICRDCNYPSEDGHTRCTLCLLRLRLASRRRRAKAPPVPTTASKADTAGPGGHHPSKPRR